MFTFLCGTFSTSYEYFHFPVHLPPHMSTFIYLCATFSSSYEYVDFFCAPHFPRHMSTFTFSCATPSTSYSILFCVCVCAPNLPPQSSTSDLSTFTFSCATHSTFVCRILHIVSCESVHFCVHHISSHPRRVHSLF